MNLRALLPAAAFLCWTTGSGFGQAPPASVPTPAPVPTAPPTAKAMPPPLKTDARLDREAVVAKARTLGLVPVSEFDAEILTDARYATADNTFRRVLYPSRFPVLLSRPSAQKLGKANAALRPHGLRLLVWDAWRPPEVQWQLFQIYQSDQYVADPRKKWSRHCYGRAVDLTLADAKGHALPMPSAFDDFSSKASATYSGSDPAVRRNLALLQQVMREAGFSPYADEWWHFNDLSDPEALKGQPVFGSDLGMPTLPPATPAPKTPVQ